MLDKHLKPKKYVSLSIHYETYMRFCKYGLFGETPDVVLNKIMDKLEEK